MWIAEWTVVTWDRYGRWSGSTDSRRSRRMTTSTTRLITRRRWCPCLVMAESSSGPSAKKFTAVVSIHAFSHFSSSVALCPGGLPLPSKTRHLGSDDCLEVRMEYNQNFSLLYCVRQLCTMIRTHLSPVLKFACWFRLRFRFCVFV